MVLFLGGTAFCVADAIAKTCRVSNHLVANMHDTGWEFFPVRPGRTYLPDQHTAATTMQAARVYKSEPGLSSPRSAVFT